MVLRMGDASSGERGLYLSSMPAAMTPKMTMPRIGMMKLRVVQALSKVFTVVSFFWVGSFIGWDYSSSKFEFST
jgi:hypothetical protein